MEMSCLEKQTSRKNGVQRGRGREPGPHSRFQTSCCWLQNALAHRKLEGSCPPPRRAYALLAAPDPMLQRPSTHRSTVPAASKRSASAFRNPWGLASVGKIGGGSVLKLTHYRVSASSDLLANRGPLGRRSSR